MKKIKIREKDDNSDEGKIRKKKNKKIRKG